MGGTFTIGIIASSTTHNAGCVCVACATCGHERRTYQAASLLDRATYSSASSLQELFTLPPVTDTPVILPQQEQLHILTMATMESAGNQGATCLRAFAKCQESSPGFRQTQTHRLASHRFICGWMTYIIHVLIGGFCRFRQAVSSSVSNKCNRPACSKLHGAL